MECEDVLKQLCDELAEDVNSETCEKLRKHLESCHDCANQLGSMRNTVNLFKCLEEKNVPSGIHERLLKMLNIDEEGEKKKV